MFDAYTYFEKLRTENKITCPPAETPNRIEYKLCKITSMQNMEEVLDKFKDAKAYFGVDDTNDGQTMQSANAGYSERRVYVVYLLKKYDIRPANAMDLQRAALQECRAIYRQICSRLIKDKPVMSNDMVYLHTDRIPYFELPGYMLSGVTGIYFMVTIDQPTDLCYDATQWN